MKELQREFDEQMMRRALSLAVKGAGHVSPNPMVGCVITDSGGSIIGEGWHRRYGESHAEVNAVASVSDRAALRGATVYVTLEPCSHWGKTPPCAGLLASLPAARVVAGMADPNPKVAGRGLELLRRSGKTVLTGVCEAECRELNRRFITAHTLGRPYVTLKWAMDAAGIMGRTEGEELPPLRYSDYLNICEVHRLRSLHDAILVGRRTAIADNPELTVRHWPGRSPRPIVAGGNGEALPDTIVLSKRTDLILAPRMDSAEQWASWLTRLWTEQGISSVLVEGGSRLLGALLTAGVWDEIRRETCALRVGGDLPAPVLPEAAQLVARETIGGHNVEWFRQLT